MAINPTTHLGRSGLVVSTVGLGTNNFGMKLDATDSRSVIDAAIDEGVTFFDTADSYGASEDVLVDEVGVIPYFPLAGGLLTGKYRRGEAPPDGSRIQAWGRQHELTDARFDIIEKLEAFAAERGITLLDVAIGGLAARPGVASVIAGATSPEQVRANVAAGAWRPGDEDQRTPDKLTRWSGGRDSDLRK